MAVLTSSHYHTSPKLKIRDVSTGTLVADIAFAKYLSPYTDTATVKSLFYLDKVLRDSTFSPNGFIGIVTTASKIAMHNSSRLLAMKDGAGYYCLDAGLNTKGECLLNSVATRWCNYIRANGWFKSAYFHNSSAHGLIVNGSYFTDGAINAEVTTTKDVKLLAQGLTAGSSIPIQTYITNPEGTNVSSATYVTLLEAIWASTGTYDGGSGTVYFLGSDPQKALASQDIVNIFFTKADFIDLNNLPPVTPPQTPSVEIIGYSNDTLTTPVQAGYYYIVNTVVSGIPTYGNSQGTSGKVFYANSSGVFTGYVDRISGSIPRVLVTAFVDSASSISITAEMQIYSNGSWVSYNNNLGSNITIPISPAWYTSPTGSPVAGSTFTPTSANLVIFQNNSIAFPRTFTVDDTGNTKAYVGPIATGAITPTPSSSTYTITYVKDPYP